MRIDRRGILLTGYLIFWASLAQIAVVAHADGTLPDRQVKIAERTKILRVIPSNSESYGDPSGIKEFRVTWRYSLVLRFVRSTESEGSCSWEIRPKITRSVSPVKTSHYDRLQEDLGFVQIPKFGEIKKIIKDVDSCSDIHKGKVEKTKAEVDRIRVEIGKPLRASMDFFRRIDQLAVHDKQSSARAIAKFSDLSGIATISFRGGDIDGNLLTLYRLLHSFNELPTVEVVLPGGKISLNDILLRENSLYKYYPKDAGFSEFLVELNSGNPRFKLSTASSILKYRPNTSIRIPKLEPDKFVFTEAITLNGSRTLAAYVRDRHLFRAYNSLVQQHLPLSKNSQKIAQVKLLNPQLRYDDAKELSLSKFGQIKFPADGWRVRVPVRVLNDSSVLTATQRNLQETLKSSKNIRIKFGADAMRTEVGIKNNSKAPASASSLANSCPDPLHSEFLQGLSSMGWPTSPVQKSEHGIAVAILDVFPAQKETAFRETDQYLNYLSETCQHVKNLRFKYSVDAAEMHISLIKDAYEHNCETWAENVGVNIQESCSTEDFENDVKACLYDPSSDMAAKEKLLGDSAKSVELSNKFREFAAKPGQLNVVPRGANAKKNHGLMVSELIAAMCNDYGLEGVAPDTVIDAYHVNGPAIFRSSALSAIDSEKPFPSLPLIVNYSMSNQKGSCSQHASTRMIPLEELMPLNRDFANAVEPLGGEFLIVAAAGNSCPSEAGKELCNDLNSKDGWLFPACAFEKQGIDKRKRKSRNTMVVGAAHKVGNRLKWHNRSNYSGEFVDIAAPWGPFKVAWNNTSTDFSGTSAAAAITTGVLSLILQAMPTDLSAKELRYRLLSTADLHVPFAGTRVKYGWLNAHRALSDLESDVVILASRPNEVLVGDLDFLYRQGSRKEISKIKLDAQQRLSGKYFQSIQMYKEGKNKIDPNYNTKFFNVMRISRNESNGLYTIIYYDKLTKDIKIERNIMFHKHGEREKHKKYLEERIKFYPKGKKEPILIVLDEIKELYTGANRDFR